MIVGCYDLHLYCRNENLPLFWEPYQEVPIGYHKGGDGPGVFSGATFSEARKESRAAGWTWQRDGDVTCPLCNRKPTPPAQLANIGDVK